MRRRSSGFTLVELLVVIGIIALLISILLPVLARARESANRIKCKSNHKQLMTAMIMYCNDFKDKVFFCNWLSQESGSGGPWTGPGWLYNSSLTGQPSTAGNVKDASTGSLYPYIKRSGILRCPFEDGPYNRGPVHFATSYAMNGAINGYGRNPVPFFTRSQFIRMAQRTPTAGRPALRGIPILCWELDEKYSGGANIYNDGSNYPPEGITRRHAPRGSKQDKGAIASCFDGSVVELSFYEWEQEQSLSPGRLWCVPDSGDGH